MKLHMLFASFITLLFVTVNLPSSGAPAVPDGWQTYTNPLGFSIRYPANWSQLELPQQTAETIHTAALQGPEGEIALHWGIGFGGACPQRYTTVKVAQGELPTCYTKRANGTEIWAQIGKQLAATSFSADARTSNAALASHDLLLRVLSTLSFPPPEQSAGALTPRMLTAPNALAGPSPSSFNWSPVGAALVYVEPQDHQDLLWLYDATSGSKKVLNPAKSPTTLT